MIGLGCKLEQPLPQPATTPLTAGEATVLPTNRPSTKTAVCNRPDDTDKLPEDQSEKFNGTEEEKNIVTQLLKANLNPENDPCFWGKIKELMGNGIPYSGVAQNRWDKPDYRYRVIIPRDSGAIYLDVSRKIVDNNEVQTLGFFLDPQAKFLRHYERPGFSYNQLIMAAERALLVSPTEWPEKEYQDPNGKTFSRREARLVTAESIRTYYLLRDGQLVIRIMGKN